MLIMIESNYLVAKDMMCGGRVGTRVNIFGKSGVECFARSSLARPEEAL